MDTELGSMFTYPTQFPWTDLGAYMGAGSVSQLSTEAEKGHYTHFNHFGPFDSSLGMPYSALRAYEAQEVAAGRPPIFVTATYQGKKRPVMYLTYLALNSDGRPTTPSSNWVYAVNIGDERFINFWLTKYVRPAVLQPMSSTKNTFVYMDGAQFAYDAYGVLDDSGRWVGGVTWDPPFQQSDAQLLQSAEYFFQRVKQLAPDIQFILDVGTMEEPSQFQNVYANIGGGLTEDALAWYYEPSQYRRDNFYNQIFPWFTWLGTSGRIGIVGANLTTNWKTVDLVSAFVVYELVKGRNSFFAPRTVSASGAGTLVPPADWQGWNAALGSPVGTYQEGSAHGDIASRLYWRQYSTGYVYLNWTGSTQTVTLPSGSWVDRNNNRITKLTIPNGTGAFVTAARSDAATAQTPAISPRCAMNISGPQTVSITSRTADATIRYTTDGSTPTTSSPVYSGPFELHGSAVVNARSFASGYNPSPVSTASYTISAGVPEVAFATSSDSVPASGAAAVSTYYPVLALSKVADEEITVTYSVLSPKNQLSKGSITLIPGQMYKQFPVSLSGTGTWKITILTASGAIPGSVPVFEITRK